MKTELPVPVLVKMLMVAAGAVVGWHSAKYLAGR